jgi:hypothetical protein
VAKPTPQPHGETAEHRQQEEGKELRRTPDERGHSEAEARDERQAYRPGRDRLRVKAAMLSTSSTVNSVLDAIHVEMATAGGEHEPQDGRQPSGFERGLPHADQQQKGRDTEVEHHLQAYDERKMPTGADPLYEGQECRVFGSDLAGTRRVGADGERSGPENAVGRRQDIGSGTVADVRPIVTCFKKQQEYQKFTCGYGSQRQYRARGTRQCDQTSSQVLKPPASRWGSQATPTPPNRIYRVGFAGARVGEGETRDDVSRRPDDWLFSAAS